ncbi:MAG: peptidoglycan-binding protein [Desulfobulbaceae bacterium]|nr:peptidoglycan-binding protein [Desulfobulbaceae bacterium]HIJ79480.1 peptidoglycan-binding protein [Deltaproteobacteria bacterium]
MPVDSFPPFDSTTYPFPQQDNEITDQWLRTYSLLAGAQGQGVVDTTIKRLTRDIQPGDPTTAIEAIPEISALNPVRFKVIAEQLWLLGYLENKPDPDQTGNIQSTQTFTSAIRRFQQEAGLTVDGWTGSETWKEIKALVNFETETDVDRWMRADGLFYRAFRRAVQLRLWAYGLADKRPGSEFNAIPPANIQRLKKLLWSLSLIDDYEQEISRKILFSMLFDPDRLVAAAAGFKPRLKVFLASDDSFADNIDHLEQHEGILQIKRRFLVNLAKVELWLLGSEVKIDGEDDYRVKGLTRKKLWGGTDKNLGTYLQEYWEKLSEFKAETATEKAKAITPSLFTSFIEPTTINEKDLKKFSEDDYSQQIAAEFEQEPNTQELVVKSYCEGKNLGMKLWDGLKRVWNWIKNGVKKIISFGKNIFRAFYRFAMKGFKIVKTACSAFAKSMDQYLAGQIEINGTNSVLAAIKKDMDFQIASNPSANAADLAKATQAVRRFGAMFFFSCQIVGVFIDFLINAVTGLAGWARLLMALVKGYRSLVPAYRELAAVL